MKGVPFSNKWYMKGVPFLKKMVYKRVRVGPRGRASLYKTFLSTLPPPRIMIDKHKELIEHG